FVMGNKSQLWWNLPAIDSFQLQKDIYDIPDDQFNTSMDFLSELLRVKKLLKIQVRKLSLGERMKCEIINSLLHMPKVLFLDEPTIGLDPVSKKAIREFFKEYNKETGSTIILTSHYLEDIKALCERIIFINKGLVIYDGALDALMKKYATKLMIRCTLSNPTSKEEFKDLDQSYEIELDNDGVQLKMVIDRDQSSKVSSLIMRNYPVEEILIEELPLEDIISKMYGDEAA
ncbi:MAG: AAA family ATPase, partial [Candidatus Hodarchaeota archaeon]